MLYQKVVENLTPLLSQNKIFGFFISGGLDSALLLHISQKIKLENNFQNTYKVFTVPRLDDSLTHSNRIVNWIDPNIEVVKIGDPTLHHSKQVLSGLILAKDLADYILLGDTSNPEHLLNGPERIKSNSPKYIQPFFEFTKKDTVKLAIELNLIELMKITHTCTESKTIRCNNCWQCKERAWGFNENNYLDPGTM